ncbi:hypothetical protein BCAR13_1700016 [Paraburkholderia caribensis]|nr:hypothetical protein BCAR13_1700016 [Paraburkholderia caribensis]
MMQRNSHAIAYGAAFRACRVRWRSPSHRAAPRKAARSALTFNRPNTIISSNAEQMLSYSSDIGSQRRDTF